MSSTNSEVNTSRKFSNCPHWGIGGRYIADPVTGVRTRVAASVPSDAPVSAPTQDGAELVEAAAKPPKEKKNA